MNRDFFKSLYEKSKSINILKDFLEWDYICDQTIEKLNDLICNKDLKLHVGPRNSLIAKRVLLERCRERLKRRFIHSGEGSNAKKKNEDLYWIDMETAFDNRIVTGAVININYIDPQQFLNNACDTVLQHVQDALRQFNSVKINTCMNGEFTVKDKTDIKSFNTKNCVLWHTSDLKEWYEEHVIKNILVQLEEFQERDSGWALSCILNLLVNINKHNPFHAGCYMDLPLDIKNKKAIVNIKTDDNTCFARAVVAALYPAKNHVDRATEYPDYKEVLNLKDITFPVTLKQITKFEKNNNLSINVFIIESDNNGKSKVLPLKLTKNYNKDRHINLLYQSKSNKSNEGHFMWVKNLSRLVDTQLSRNKRKKYLCDRCLCYIPSLERLEAHRINCFELNTCRVVLPTKDEDKIMRFKRNHRVKLRVPFTIYADLESILLKEEDEDMRKKKSYAFQHHEAFAIGYYAHCAYNNSLFKYKSYRGKDGAVTWFISELKNFVNYVMDNEYSINVPMEKFTDNEWKEIYKKFKNCSICEKPFKKEDTIHRDHCHFTGKFRGLAHQSCNLNYKNSYTIPVVFHNLSGYDIHFLINEIADSFNSATNLLALTKEKYISVTQHIAFKGKRNIKLQFIDSLKFLNNSLDKLSSYIDTSKLKIVKSHFEDITTEKFSLLTRKGIFPYEYIDNYDKLNEQSLPQQDAFFSSLTGDSVSNEDYNHAKNVWKEFEIQTLGEYSDLYLKLDVLLLADVFENFRDNCLKTYELDPAYYHTLPGYTWDAMLKYTGIELEILTDVDMVYFFERGVRGGITQCITRHARSNNKYMGNSFDSTKPSKYLTYFDINNMYGYAMSQPLPYGNFEWLSDVSKFDVFSIPADSDVGYVLEVDLTYPKNLHDLHAQFPFCPTHDKSPKSGEQKKLMTTLYDKKHYIIHYSNLQQCLNYGLQITKIHRILKFSQSPWLKNYIDLNTLLRQRATNDFEKNLYKLMNNAIYGKTMENVRNYVNVRLIKKWEGRYGLEAAIAQPNFHSRSIFSEKCAAVQFSKLEVTFNKPIYVGMCILDISKTLLYDFHYEYMLKTYPGKCNLLYMDTDSLMHEVECDDVYSDIRNNLSRFDTSDYPRDNIYNIPLVNKKIVGLMKDECAGEIFTDFVGLRSKMYAYKVSNQETKKIKGIKRNVIAKTITFDDYLTCLFENSEISCEQVSIRSKLHKVYTIREEKIALNPCDDKRFILDDGIHTLPWGYYGLADYDNVTDNNCIVE